MAKTQKINEKQLRMFSAIVDFLAVFLAVSVFNYFILNVFNLSPEILLKQGIETSLYQQKVHILEYLSIVYILVIIAYFIFLRRYFSLGNKYFKLK